MNNFKNDYYLMPEYEWQYFLKKYKNEYGYYRWQSKYDKTIYANGGDYVYEIKKRFEHRHPIKWELCENTFENIEIDACQLKWLNPNANFNQLLYSTMDWVFKWYNEDCRPDKTHLVEMVMRAFDNPIQPPKIYKVNKTMTDENANVMAIKNKKESKWNDWVALYDEQDGEMNARKFGCSNATYYRWLKWYKEEHPVADVSLKQAEIIEAQPIGQSTTIYEPTMSIGGLTIRDPFSVSLDNAPKLDVKDPLLVTMDNAPKQSGWTFEGGHNTISKGEYMKRNIDEINNLGL